MPDIALRITIDFTSATTSEVHRIRNFGEDLFRAFKANGWAEISLDAVDMAVDRLVVAVSHRKKLRRVEALIAERLKKHRLDGVSAVTCD